MIIKKDNNDYVYGYHAVYALLNGLHRKAKIIYTIHNHLIKQNKLLKSIYYLAKKKNVPIQIIEKNKISKIFSNIKHTIQIVAITKKIEYYHESDLSILLNQYCKPYLILILESITDIRNLGSCLRTAEIFNVDFVIIRKNKNITINPIISKISSGAIEFLKIMIVNNLHNIIRILQEQGVWIFGATPNQKTNNTIYTCNFNVSTALIIGSEHTGMRLHTKINCDYVFSIPMFGKTESLNVSVATGICLYEILRQRMKIS